MGPLTENRRKAMKARLMRLATVVGALAVVVEVLGAGCKW
jgi:hypothetical protein